MACYQPITLWAQQQYAWEVSHHKVGCGLCLGCRKEQARHWTVRCLHESTQHDESVFVTLTYDEDWLPQYGTLSPEDSRAFIKRLRRYHEATRAETWERTLSYYLVGEYGDLSSRPHYHALLFGISFPDKRIARTDPSGNVWESKILSKLWRYGRSEFSTVTPGSAAYVTQYATKKVAAKDGGVEKFYDDAGNSFYHPRIYTRVDDRTGELVPVVPEYSRVSKNPAVGKRWIAKYYQDVYPRDYVLDESLTVQSDREYTDIKKMIRRQYPGIIESLKDADLNFLDVTEFTDLTDALLQSKEAEVHFMKLQPAVRRVFNNNVAEWLDAAKDPEKLEWYRPQLEKLGVLKVRDIPTVESGNPPQEIVE